LVEAVTVLANALHSVDRLYQAELLFCTFHTTSWL
jgi:hypothetical protein